MNEDLDVNILVQTFNEKISQMMTDLIIKETTIRQLNATIAKLAKETAKNTKPEKIKEAE
jgi:hypothetical protein